MRSNRLIVGALALAATASAAYFTSSEFFASKMVETNNAKTDFREKKKSAYEPKGHAELMRLRRTTPDGITYGPGEIFAEYKKAIEASRNQRTEETLDWKQRGPGNVGTRVRGLIVDAADATGNTWFIGSTGAGIWKTIDAGNTWTSLTPTLPHLVFTSVAQCKANPSVLYAGTGEDVFSGGSGVSGAGVFKSEDAGKTWTSLTSTVGSLDFINVNDIVVSPTDANIVTAATSSGFSRSTGFQAGIMRSTDGGKTWTKTYQPRSFPFSLTVDPNNPSVMYSGILYDGLAKSIDGGVKWTLTGLANISKAHSDGKDPGRTEVTIHPKNSNLVIASMDYYDETGGSNVFISENAGTTWKVFEDDSQKGYNFIEQGIFGNCITSHPTDETEFYVGGVLLTRNKIITGSTRVGTRSFLGTDLVNMDWISFTNFSQAYMGGALSITSIPAAKNVEVRFGPGLKQKAHRFLACGGNFGAGCADDKYEYVDIVDVPFQVWDIDNNKQLAVSFRDNENNGVFNLNARAADDTDLLKNREYIFIHTLDYTETANAAIAKKGGHAISRMMFFWPNLATGQTWDASKLPTSTIRFNVGSLTYQKGKINPMSDVFVANVGKNPHVDHHILVAAPKQDGSFRLISGNDGGVAYTDKATIANAGDGSFIIVNKGGYNTGMSYTVSKKVGSSEYMTGMQDNDVYFSPANPAPNSDWTSAQTNGDGTGVLYNFTDGKKMLASRQYNDIKRSIDGGLTWSQVNISDNNVTKAAPFITKIEASDKAPDVVYAVGESGVWKSTNFGSSFTSIKLTDGWGTSYGALDIRVSEKDANTVWAGSTMSEGTGNIFVAIDGKTFKATKNYVTGLTTAAGAPIEMGTVSGIYPDPNDAKTAYLLFSQPGRPKILKTTDVGRTWVDISGFGTAGVSSKGFPNVGVQSLLVFPEGKEIWAGTDIGLVISKDAGATWSLANNGLPNVPVYDIRYRDKQIVLATHGLGVWSVDKELIYKDGSGGGGGGGDTTTTGIFTNIKALAIKVYPNPTTDVVRFELPEVGGGEYKVSVFAINGQTVMNKTVQTGGNVELSLGNLNRGTYVIQATSGGLTYTQKVVVEK